jgi:internalin A
VDLQSLYASGTGLTDISGLSSCTPLNTVELQQNAITGTPDFTFASQLSVLKLGNNPLGGPPKISGLESLRELVLNETGLTSLAGLGLPSLTSLEVLGNPVSDLSPLATATGLTKLRVGGTTDVQPASIGFVSSLTQLQWLDVYNAKIEALSVLEPLESLRTLNFDHVTLGASGLEGLEKLTGLTSLTLNYTNATDFSALSSLTNLGALNLYGNPGLTDLSPLVENTGLAAPDGVYVYDNGFKANCGAQADQIAALKATGLTWYSDCP